MSKTVKIWLIVGAALILVSAILFIIALAFCGWDITKLGTANYVTTTYEPSGDFKSITVNVHTTDLEFLPSEDGKCRIVCCEDERVKHTTEVKDGTLVIGTEDTRRWWLNFISLSFISPKMTVYLPPNEYGSLDISTDTGAVHLPKNFTFESIKIAGHTGAVNCSASVEGGVDIKLNTGAITLSDVSAGSMKLKTNTGSIELSGDVDENIDVEASTGMLRLKNITCGDLRVKNSTGFIKLENVISAGFLEIRNKTGDVALEQSDAAELYIETSTGSVSGELLTDKIFFAESNIGQVSVPKSTTGGRCEIKTNTGSIDVSVKE